MADDKLADLSPEDVAAWYGRLADKIDERKINNERSLASQLLKIWLLPGEAKSKTWMFAPPKHLREHSAVLDVLAYHRDVYLTNKKARINGDEKWAGVIPRLQGKKGFTKWDGRHDLEMQYHSLVEIPLRYQLTGNDADKDLLYSLRGFQLHTSVVVKLEPATGTKKKVVFTKAAAWVEDRYDFDAGEHITVPNPDYGRSAADSVAPELEKIRVFHSNAKRIQRKGLAADYEVRFMPWVIVFAPGIIEPERSLGWW